MEKVNDIQKILKDKYNKQSTDFSLIEMLLIIFFFIANFLFGIGFPF